MRIVSGRWGGRHLQSPGKRVRPTAETVRDAAASWLAPDLEGARVVDLFAGTGAVGLELLSRGAKSVDFVERSPAALHSLKANVARLRVRDRTRIFKKDAVGFMESLAAGAYEVAFADPPWTSRLADRVVERWLDDPFSSVLLVEAAGDRTLPGRGKRRVVADASLTLYRR